MRRRRASRLALTSIVMLLASSSLTRAFDFKDGDFAGGWSFVSIQTGTGGTFSASIAGGGNPGNALLTNTHINGNCGAIFGFGFHTNAVWDPSTQGPITRLNYAEDARLVNGFGGGQANGPAIRQGGNYYRLPGNATGTNTSWYTLSLSNLSASQFVRVVPFASCGNETDPSSHPDFSGSGGPIEFGFYRANSQINGQGAYDIQAALDNFHVTVNGVAYVALGDSFSAGEGLGSYLPGTNDVSPRNVCHRSNKAYGFLIQFPNVDLTADNFLACSGAETSGVLNYPLGFPPSAAPGEPPQLERTRSGAPIVNENTEMITLSVGGNDVGFVLILTDCILELEHDCSSDAYRPLASFGDNRSFKQIVEARLPLYAPLIGLTHQSVKSQSGDAPTFVLGYPRLFGKGPGNSCLWAPGISSAEAKWLDALSDKLNAVVSLQAAFAGVQFVSVTAAFNKHGACSPTANWINGLILGSTASFHPTAAGQWAYARTLDLDMNNKVNGNWPLSDAGIPENPGAFVSSAPAQPSIPQGTGDEPSLGSLVVTEWAPFCSSRNQFVPGQDIAVAGAGFAANSAVSLRLTGPGGYVSNFATPTANASGVLDTVVVLPANAPTNATARLDAHGTGAAGEIRWLGTHVRLSTSYLSDVDFDEIPDPCDRCPIDFDFKNIDTDDDGVGDVCDACPQDSDNDLDHDGLCAGVDPCPWDAANDADGDDACESTDNCPLVTNFNQIDSDNDGAGDACDAAEEDPGVFAIPGEVEDVEFGDDDTVLSWTSAVHTSGINTVHDVARGALNAFPVGAATCLLSGSAAETVTDATEPAAGQGFWYLVRGRNSLGNGTWGQETGGAPRNVPGCP